MLRMAQYTFDLRFRTENEEEGQGSLAFQYSSHGTSLPTIVRDAVDAVQRQHPDAVFDRMIYYSKITI